MIAPDGAVVTCTPACRLHNCHSGDQFDDAQPIPIAAHQAATRAGGAIASGNNRLAAASEAVP